MFKQAELEALFSSPSQSVPTAKRDGQDNSWALSGNMQVIYKIQKVNMIRWRNKTNKTLLNWK